MPKTTQTPGTMLKTLLAKYKMPVGRLAEEIHTSDALMYLVTQDKSRITVPVACRLAKFFNTNPEYWLTAQMKYDVAKAAADKELQKALKSISKVSMSKE